MISALKDHWPAIQQYPWAFLWVFASGFTLGLALPAAWRWLFPAAPGASRGQDGLHALPAKRTAREFRPTKVHTDCIDALRFVDDRYIEPYQVQGFLDRKYALSDVTHALEQLASEGWARTNFQMNPKTPGKVVAAFALWGPGLEYARKKGFQTGI